jgi:hypothetical protein
MITQEEMQQAIDQALAEFSSGYMDDKGDEHSIYEIMRSIKEIPEKYQYGIIRLYNLISSLKGYIYSHDFEHQDEIAYLRNLMKKAIGEPRRWQVCLEPKSRPFPHMLAHVIPFGTLIDETFQKEEQKSTDVKNYIPPTEICITEGGEKKAKLVEDSWIMKHKLGFIRKLVYEEVVN